MIRNQLSNYCGLRTVPASEAGMIMGLTPVTALLLGMVLLAEQISARQAVGMVLILVSVWMINRS